MTSDELELVRGSGNVFRDFGDPDAEALQLKAVLADNIIDVSTCWTSRRSTCGAHRSSRAMRRPIFRVCVRQSFSVSRWIRDLERAPLIKSGPEHGHRQYGMTQAVSAT